jgi:hypothetical protein
LNLKGYYLTQVSWELLFEIFFFSSNLPSLPRRRVRIVNPAENAKKKIPDLFTNL